MYACVPPRVRVSPGLRLRSEAASAADPFRSSSVEVVELTPGSCTEAGVPEDCPLRTHVLTVTYIHPEVRESPYRAIVMGEDEEGRGELQ